MNIIISRPVKKEKEKLKNFFTEVIIHTFKNYGYYDKYKQDIDYEVGKQTTALEQDLTSNGSFSYFLIARDRDKIVGTIAYGPPNSDIKKYYKDDLKNIPEIKSVYIAPEYQGKGIGTKLFDEMIKVLRKKGFSEFCLDSGYPKAQQFWKNKLGNPVKIVFDRWDAGNDYMIWHYKLPIISPHQG